MTRLAPGVYVDSLAWRSLSSAEQYGARVRARLLRIPDARLIASHWSAAALWNFPVLDSWPSEVQVIDPSRTRGHRTPTLVRRPGPIDPDDILLDAGLVITTPSRTAVDIALTEGFTAAVLVFDHGLRHGLFEKGHLHAHLDRRPKARRLRAARRAVDFADPGAASAAESFSRVAFLTTGMPIPLLQVPFFDSSGKIGDTDCFWSEFGIVGECDGDLKYLDARYRNGRTAERVVLDEKRRQTRLESHRLVRRVVRWDYALSRQPERLAARLVDAGLPRLDARSAASRLASRAVQESAPID
ncbi:hypothetical protein GCM10025780_12120 [Frondihabitans cladoniiphilus]|uniref:Transcriptional regulator, AbiEi antitoxin, Type IV TA system n=1 Tax=Frondihabitans cladoniiphilus TaxID=715785 RepID=A0ABP8VUC3_9MICO